MPGSHWMLVLSPEDWETSRERGVDVIGLRQRHRKKAERMALGDRVLFYVARRRVFTATATVTSTYFQDQAPLWRGSSAQGEDFPYRVQTEPAALLEPSEYIDAYQIAPRLLYLKRWAPEDWQLAFQGDIHLFSAADFRLVEREMERMVEVRSGARARGPSRGSPAKQPPTPLVSRSPG